MFRGVRGRQLCLGDGGKVGGQSWHREEHEQRGAEAGEFGVCLRKSRPHCGSGWNKFIYGGAGVRDEGASGQILQVLEIGA